MVRGTQAVETPHAARQHAITELFPFAPPLVPNPPEMAVHSAPIAAQLGGQQPADAKQSRLACRRRAGERQPLQARLRQALHGPDVLLVTERAEYSLPQRLLPPRLPRAGRELS